MVFEMVFVPNVCTVKTYGKTWVNYGMNGTTSEFRPIRPKQAKSKKYFYWKFLEKLGTTITNKTPAKSKDSNYGP